MELLKQEFDNIKESNNPVIINDFIIKLSENPNIDNLIYLEYFIETLETQTFDKIKLNLIFLLGEIGNLSTLDFKFLNFLLETYYKSDRWVRNEIIQAFGKILSNTNLLEDIIKLIGNAINDDYSPISISALKALLKLKEIPSFVRRNIFLALNKKNAEVEAGCVKILEKFLPSFHQLFKSLDYSKNYQLLKPKAIKTILLIYFRFPLDLESFRQLISNTDWEGEYKEIYLKEIDTYEKILLKRI